MVAAGPAVLIPAFNEEATVGAVIAEVLAVLPGARVVVVDDGSTDATSARARDAGADVLRLPINLGVGGALRTGLRHAERAGFAPVLQVDGDGQHDPRHAPVLLAALADADLVVGARFAGEGDYAVPGAQRLVMRLLARRVGGIVGVELTDVTSGYRAFGPRAVDLFARELPQEYLGDTVDALLLAGGAGLRIRQVPVAMRPRAGGRPSQTLLRGAMHLSRVLVRLAMTGRRSGGR